MRRISVQQFLEIVRARPRTVPQAVATHLFASAVSRAALVGASLRPAMVVLDAEEGVLLELTRESADGATTDAGYVSPEALNGSAPPDDPRVLVYAAGALGYQLLTGEPPPQPPARPHPQLTGPIGEVVRVALAPDWRDRFTGLEQMRDALQAVLHTPSPEIERNLFAAVFALCSRWASDVAPAAGLRAAAERVESGGAMPTVAQVVRWVRATDEVVENLQRQQVELVLTVAAHEMLGTAAAQRLEGAGRALRMEDQIELLERIATLAPAPAPPPVRERQGRASLRWAGPIAASAVVAGAVSLVLRPAPPAGGANPPVASADAHPVPPAADRAILVSPVVLSIPNEEPREPAPEARQAPQATRGPATPRPVVATAPKLVNSRPDPVDVLLDRGQRALRQGRAAEALAAFNEALHANPDLAPAVRGVALSYLMQRRNREAKEQLDRYLKLAPEAVDAPRMRKLAKSLNASAARR